MQAITRAQREAIKRIFDRAPNYPDGRSAAQIATANGWMFFSIDEAPASLRERMLDAGITYVWAHDKYLPLYLDSQNIVEDYRLATPLTYGQFRRTVKQGYDCLMVRWQGMWLGIETDGYTHS